MLHGCSVHGVQLPHEAVRHASKCLQSSRSSLVIESFRHSRMQGSPSSVTQACKPGGGCCSRAPTIAGGNDDGDGGGELQAEAARVGDLDCLHAQHAHDLVAVRGQPGHNTQASDHQDPLRHRGLGGDILVLPDVVNGGEGPYTESTRHSRIAHSAILCVASTYTSVVSALWLTPC